MRDFLKVGLPVAFIIVLGFAVAWHFVDPAPPRTITIATGSPDGAYAGFARQYADILKQSGVTVKIRHTAGARENLALLNDPKSDVSVALIQGGIGDPFGAPKLRALASLFYEPLWLLVRSGAAPKHLGDLKGKRIAIGVKGSGTRVLALTLLAANGVDGDNSTLVSAGGAEARAMLGFAKVDAAFFVTAKLSAGLLAQSRRRSIHIMSFSRADAYMRQYAYLSRVTLPEGALDLESNTPPRDLTLLAPTAALMARDDLHPAITDLLMGAVTKVHRAGGLTTPAALFPSDRFLDFPLDEHAERYLKSGPSFLRRVLPFWAAVMAERLMILLVPLLTLLFPLFKIAPPAYRWGVRRRIYRWYRELRAIEDDFRKGDAAPDALIRQLDQIQAQVGQLHVPLGHTEQLYHLRLHIAFVKSLITA